VPDGGPAGVDVGVPGVPAGLPAECVGPDVEPGPEVPPALCPPPAGVTPAQSIVGTTEFAFGWPAEAIWARQRPGKAFGLGPFPCRLDEMDLGLDELPVEPPDPGVSVGDPEELLPPCGAE
jgi:hypothetical protein